MNLNHLKPGQSAVVLSVGGEGALRQHFLDMGVIPGAEITFVKSAPMGDPMEFTLHGYELTLRVDDAAQIAVELTQTEETRPEAKPRRKIHVCEEALHCFYRADKNNQGKYCFARAYNKHLR